MAPTIEKSDLVSDSIKKLFHDLLEENGITVTNVNIEAGSIKGDNYLGVIAKAEVTGKDKKGKEFSESYIIKSAPRSEGLRKFAPIRVAYECEIYVYSHILPKFQQFQKVRNIKNPFASYAQYLKSSDQDKDEALIMKDMKSLGYFMQNRKEPLDINHVRLVIRELARYHSLSFALRDQEPEVFEKFAQHNSKNYFKEMDLSNFDIHATKQCDKAQNTLLPGDEDALEKFKIFRKNYIDHFTTLLDDHCHPHSVIRHGDCWTNNFLFAYHDKSKPKVPTNLCFLDWQLSLIGAPVIDLLYFTNACTDKKLRDEHYDQLLREYFQILKDFTKELGTDLDKYYSFEIMQQQFKKFGKYGLAIGIMLLHLVLSDSDEIPDINEVFDDLDDHEKVMEAFSFESKNIEAYNHRVRDIILFAVEREFI